jgi:hypothetical protein
LTMSLKYFEIGLNILSHHRVCPLYHMAKYRGKIGLTHLSVTHIWRGGIYLSAFRILVLHIGQV